MSAIERQRGVPSPTLLGISRLLTDDVSADQNTLRRGIAALWHMAMHESLSVTELANLVPCDKSQASRVLKVLAEYGMVRRDQDTQRYHLGWLVYACSMRVSGRQMVSIAGPVVRQLAARTHETCWIAVLSGTEVLTLYTFRPRGGQMIINESIGGVPPGGVVPIHCTASGRALLCGLDDSSLTTLLKNVVYDSAGPNAPRTMPEVLERINVDRERGVSVTIDELQLGTSSVAAPVHDGGGQPTMAIGLSGKTSRVQTGLDIVTGEVKMASRQITARLFAEREAREISRSGTGRLR